MAGKTYCVHLEDSTMEDTEEEKQWTIRRAEDKGNGKLKERENGARK